MRLSPWTSNQGQGLRRIMKSPISSRSMGCFSLLHSKDAHRILYYHELHSCSTVQKQRHSGHNQRDTLQINNNKYRRVATKATMAILSFFIIIIIIIIIFNTITKWLFYARVPLSTHYAGLTFILSLEKKVVAQMVSSRKSSVMETC